MPRVTTLRRASSQESDAFERLRRHERELVARAGAAGEGAAPAGVAVAFEASARDRGGRLDARDRRLRFGREEEAATTPSPGSVP